MWKDKNWRSIGFSPLMSLSLSEFWSPDQCLGFVSVCLLCLCLLCLCLCLVIYSYLTRPKSLWHCSMFHNAGIFFCLPDFDYVCRNDHDNDRIARSFQTDFFSCLESMIIMFFIIDNSLNNICKYFAVVLRVFYLERRDFSFFLFFILSFFFFLSFFRFFFVFSFFHLSLLSLFLLFFTFYFFSSHFETHFSRMEVWLLLLRHSLFDEDVPFLLFTFVK